MYQLSRREKILLFVLSVVLLLAGGFALLVNPLLQQRLALQQTLSDEQFAQMSMEASIASAPAAAIARDDAREAARLVGQTFYAPMSNTQLSNLTASFLDLHGLTGASMSLSGITVQDLAGVQPTLEAASSYAWSDLIQGADGGADLTQAPDAAPGSATQDKTAQVLCNSVTISGIGADADLRSLLTDLSPRIPVRVQSISMDAEQKFSLVLSFYMLDVIP